MGTREKLNYVKWQLNNRLPYGGLFEKTFIPHFQAGLNKYVFLDDVYKSKLLKLIFGSRLISEENLRDFFDYLHKYFYNSEFDCFEFIVDGKPIRLPIYESLVYRYELMDLIIPYVLGYPENKQLPFHEGPYENDSVFVRNGDTVIDCGANIGMFSAYASSRGAQVYAFEPTNDTIEKFLSVTAKLNPNITIEKYAVSDKTSKESFGINERNIGANSFTSITCSESSRIISVDTISLDEFVSKENLDRVDFIKADIEGAERLMLKGARNVLKDFAPDLSICYYHLLDDYKVLTDLIRDANDDYIITKRYRKIYAYSKKNIRNR